MMDAISLPYTVVDTPDKVSAIGAAYRHSRIISRPVVVAITRGVLLGER